MTSTPHSIPFTTLCSLSKHQRNLLISTSMYMPPFWTPASAICLKTASLRQNLAAKVWVVWMMYSTEHTWGEWTPKTVAISWVSYKVNSSPVTMPLHSYWGTVWRYCQTAKWKCLQQIPSFFASLWLLQKESHHNHHQEQILVPFLVELELVWWRSFWSYWSFWYWLSQGKDEQNWTCKIINIIIITRIANTVRSVAVHYWWGKIHNSN